MPSSPLQGDEAVMSPSDGHPSVMTPILAYKWRNDTAISSLVYDGEASRMQKKLLSTTASKLNIDSL